MAKDRGRIIRDEERGETHYVTSEGMSGCEECGATLDLYTGKCPHCNLCGMCGGNSYELCDNHAEAEAATWD